MTVKEFYTAIGGDYEGVCARLYSEQLVKKFLLKFLDDGSFNALEASLKEGNDEEAFRAAHTIKGVCQNLGLDNLYSPAYALTEALRGGKKEGADELFLKVKAEYENTVSNLKNLRDEN